MSQEPQQTNAIPITAHTGGLIYRLMPEVMKRVGAIEKTRENQEQKFKFRGIDDVHAALQQILADVGVFYMPEVLEAETVERLRYQDKKSYHTFLKVRYTFYAADGSSVQAVMRGEGLDHGSDKGSNKAMSAAEKYALLQAFCIPCEEQAESDKESPNVNEDAQAPRGRAAAGRAAPTQAPAGNAKPAAANAKAPAARKPAKPVRPTDEMVAEISRLLSVTTPPDDEVNAWFDKASENAGRQIESYDQMRYETVEYLIGLMQQRERDRKVAGATPAPNARPGRSAPRPTAA